MDNASKCPVSGKRKYATEGAALATAKHQVATADAPLELRAYRCTWLPRLAPYEEIQKKN